jgi:hypothetical protein
MKKITIYFATAAILIGIGSCFNYFISNSNESLTETQLANIEALSGVELPGNNIRDQYCTQDNSFFCTIYWSYEGSSDINSTSYAGYRSK